MYNMTYECADVCSWKRMYVKIIDWYSLWRSKFFLSFTHTYFRVFQFVHKVTWLHNYFRQILRAGRVKRKPLFGAFFNFFKGVLDIWWGAAFKAQNSPFDNSCSNKVSLFHLYKQCWLKQFLQKIFHTIPAML